MAVVWTPLESNPTVINPVRRLGGLMIEKMGVSGVKTVDVLFFEDDSIGQPQHAVILCFPEYKKVDEIMKPIYEQAKAADDSVFFMKQKISNACGTFALFHSLANLEDRINLGDGAFAKWLAEAKKVGVDERSDLLANNAELTAIHAAAATAGQTDPSGEVEHHFICYVGKNGILYEIDSRLQFAREIGPTSEATLVKDAGAACQHLIQKLDNVSFSAIALVNQ